MIQLLSVELVNYRLVREARIDFPDDGITAINGDVGAGKSSYLSGMLWALYGVTPDGVQVAGVRRQGSEGQPCRVTVRFRHDGQLIEATRALEGRKDSTTALLKIDGVEAVKRPVAVAKWVEDRIGLDDNGFTTACVVMQKSVDALVKLKPEARRTLMERMFGIERLTEGVKNARDETTAAKKYLDGLPGTGEELTAANAMLLTAQTHATAMWEAFETARAAAEAAVAVADATAATWAQVQDGVRVHQAARADADRAGHARDLATADAARAAADLDRLTAASAGGDAESLAAADEACQQASRAFARNEQAEAETARARTLADRDQAQATALATRAAEAAAQAKALRVAATSQSALAADLAAQSADAGRADEHRAAADRAAQDRGAALADHQRVSASLALLDASSSPACPTCKTGLADPAALRAELAAELAAVTARGVAAKTAAETATAAADEAARIEQAAARAADQATVAAERADQADADSRRAAADAKAAAATAAESNAEADRLAALAAEHAKDTDRLAREKDAAAARLRDVQRAADALAALPAAQAAASATRAAAEKAETAAEEAEKAADTAAVPEATVADARTAAETAARDRLATATASAEARGVADVAGEQADRAEADRDRARDKLAARADALSRWEQKSAVSEALAVFRKDRIAQIGPELSEIASDLLARLSDGAYVHVELDENFTPFVTSAEGNVRPVAMLSGGEESQVALALLIAAGDVVSGQRGGLLMLDEVLTSQNKDKRAPIIAAIRALPGRQIVMINHASEATDMVDHVFHMIRDETNGCYLATHVAGGVTDDDLDGETLGVLTDELVSAGEPAVDAA